MGQKASILIVDDNISLFKTMSFVLKHKGFAVTTVESGIDAIELVKKNNYDLIFMDIKMPVMNGVESYKEIKRIRPDVVVMMMTAYSVEELVQEALVEGAFGILYKPLNVEQMIATVQDAKEKGGLILVIDDDPSICATLKKILTKRSYKVVTTTTGEKAIELAKKNKFDLILIDMKLPVLNGLETYLALKEIDQNIIAIMMTAYGQEMNQLVSNALSESAYACLPKPLNIENTLRMINEILQKK